VRTEFAILPAPIALGALLLREIEDERHGQAMKLPRQRDQRLSGLLLDISGIDHGQPTSGQPPGPDEVEDLKGILGCRLFVLVVRHESATEVRRQHLGRLEVLSGKDRLAGAGRSDQDDERQFRNGDFHRVNTAICVGGPT